MRRAGGEHEGPPVGAAAQVADHHLVAGPPVIGGGELLQDLRLGSRRAVLAGGPHEQAQLRAGPGPRVRQQVHLAAAGLAAHRDHLPQPDQPARYQTGRRRPGAHRHGRPGPRGGWPPLQPREQEPPAPGISLPGGQGQVEVRHDLVGNLVIERTDSRQQVRDPAHPDPALAPGRCGTAQLFLGQQPQVRFRPLTVHLPSVPGPGPGCQRPAGVDTFPLDRVHRDAGLVLPGFVPAVDPAPRGWRQRGQPRIHLARAP